MKKISIGHFEGAFAKTIKKNVKIEKKAFSHFDYRSSLTFL